ncbi:DNA repair protein RecN [Blautia stercoris]|uniref:DNA repair protein RecN n=1 Tax=Blautia stercoris TaxID=871664 RepID=UPI00355B0927
MLLHLHVKNLALIDEAEVDFTEGLNILTGETGAGKSILIGSINLALGQKASKSMIREHAEYAFVELVFEAGERTAEKLKQMDIFPDDGQVIISRKLTGNRSICKINGETCTVSMVKQAAFYLLDIHGQHEHQSLLYPEKQMEILDAYGKEEIQKKREQVQKDYETYKALRKELEQYEIDEEQKKRQMDFLAFEISEIEDAKLKVGEDEELEAQYRKMINAKRITESLSEVYELTGYEREGSSEQIGRAVRQLSQVSELDDDLKGIYETLNDIDALLSDFNRELSSYLSGFQFSQEEFLETEERLNLLNHLKSKYGASIEAVLEYKQEKEEEYEALEHFEQNQAELKRKIKEQETVLQKQCECLTKSRKKWAKSLEKEIIEGLQELNFLDVAFEIVFEEKAEFSSNGKDSICFFISTNPGEPKRELQKVVSGGELSRIMLAIKTILADKDEKETLIFDEIDTGISGKTAWKVSEKMAVIAKSHQVLCITHLPQIAAQADSHFLIEKSVKELETQTKIWRLDEEKSVEELARMLGGESITETVLSNAREMKEMAQQQKNTRVK